MQLRPVFCMLALWLAAAPVSGQTNGEGNFASPDRCQAAPDDSRQGRDKDRSATEPLSETLEDCHGVLKPPATGDGEMTEPAPDVGRTPVIRPGDLPQAQSPQ